MPQPKKIPSVKHLMDELAWTDLGEVAHRWGGQDEEHTCQAHGDAKSSRRDYILANAEVIPFIKDFKTIRDDEIPVHDILQIQLSAEGTEHHIFENKCPLHFGVLLQEQIENRTEGMPQKEAAKAKEDILHRIHAIMDRNFQINEDVLGTMLTQRKGDEFYEKP